MIQTQIQVLIQTQIQLQMCWLDPWIPCTWLVPLLHFHNRNYLQKQRHKTQIQVMIQTQIQFIIQTQIQVLIQTQVQVKIQTQRNKKCVDWIPEYPALDRYLSFISTIEKKTYKNKDNFWLQTQIKLQMCYLIQK